MTIPNLLTLLRLVLIFPFCYYVTAGIQYDTVALFLFVIAACTDWFDGFYARRYKQFSDAGKLLDPLADKLLVTTALVAFVADETISLPVWSVVVVLGREFLITGLRGMLAQYQVVMAADQLGKAKAASQMAAIFLFLVARDPSAGGGGSGSAFLTLSMMVYYVAVIMTILSGLEYLWQHRALIIKSFQLSSEQP